MSTAKVAGGVYYVRGIPLDAEGNRVDNAPELAADTSPDEQPGSVGAKTPAQEIGEAFAHAMTIQQQNNLRGSVSSKSDNREK